jgi:hypothetical protein
MNATAWFRLRVPLVLFVLLIGASWFNCVHADEVAFADSIYFGGHIVTVDPSQPNAEWIAVQGDRIQALGNGREFEALVGPKTQQIDLRGRL